MPTLGQRGPADHQMTGPRSSLTSSNSAPIVGSFECNSGRVESFDTMQANAGGIVDADGLGTGLGGRRRLSGRGGARTAAPSEAGTDLRRATGRWSVLDETRQPPKCYVWRQSLKRDESVTWTGSCADGRADGLGVLKLSWKGTAFRVVAVEGTGILRSGRMEGRWIERFVRGTVWKGYTWRARGMDAGSRASRARVPGSRSGSTAQWSTASA